MASSLNRPVDHMFRAGQISPKAYARLKAQHGWSPGRGARTRGQMAPFHGKGTKDEGGVRDGGAVSYTHLDLARHQSVGTPARASGLASPGGRVNGPQRSPAPRAHIDDAMTNMPEFPSGLRVRGRTDLGPPRRLSAQTGPVPPLGGSYYGGGGQDAQ